MSFPAGITPPSLEDVKNVSGISRIAARDWDKYYDRSVRLSSIMAETLARYYAEPYAGLRVLDWGSALGGIAILLADQYALEMLAADVDRYSMEWLQKQNANVTCWKLTPQQKFPFEDRFFSVVYGISVFTHIPPDWVEFYLGELGRVVEKGGLVCMSIHGPHHVEHVPAEGNNAELMPKSVEELRDAGIFYCSYPQDEQARMEFTKDGDYGMAFHSTKYIESVFGKYFDILSIEEGRIGHQDLICMRSR